MPFRPALRALAAASGLLAASAAAAAAKSPAERTAHLPAWTHSYNWHHLHGGIGSKPPISRLALEEDRLLRFHI